MPHNAILAYTPFFPPGPARHSPNRTNRTFDKKPPKQPDWVMILMGILFLMTLLLLSLVDVPSL
jgi:hypothetical protein